MAAPLTGLPEYKALLAHHKLMLQENMRDFFDKDPKRFDKFKYVFQYN